MKRIILLISSMLFSVLALAKHVTPDEARYVADNYFIHFSSRYGVVLKDFFSVEYKGTTVYYVFNYSGGGFVAVAADDAAIPVLAQSDEGFLEKEISSPEAKYWFECYSKELAGIISAGADNSLTLKIWERIRNDEFAPGTRDSGPFLTTTWDQGQWYNYYCPADQAGQGGHAWAGCVATAMGQIMKFHSYPSHGFLARTYDHPEYGTLSADFGATTYNWSSMGTIADGSSYQDIATLIFQAGISVEMNYSTTGSGAADTDIPWAMITYFNYDPSTIRIERKADYTDAVWKEMIKSDLDASLPLYYGGDNGTDGHAWVCDGWRSGDDMFHMNWGWSGLANGWYTIGALNTVEGNYNYNNTIIRGIRPGNADLIARIMTLEQGQIIGYGTEVDVNCKLINGTADGLNLYVDGDLVCSTSSPNFTYHLVTTEYPLGTHTVRLEAVAAEDTVYHEVEVANFGWDSQESAFPIASRGIKYIHAVDPMVAWAVAYDGANTSNYIQEFTRTENGGETWTSGTISNCLGLEPAMIFALNADTAFCPMYRQTGGNPQGIYVTYDGGTNWSRQTGAFFSDPASFPDVIHFFSKYDGFCMGDPINNEFEIYTTTDGGYSWNQVTGDVIPDPEPGEFGVTGYYCTVGDNVWFGTNKGRVYRSADRGRHWEVSTTTFPGRYVDVRFSDASHGLAQDKNVGTSGALCETSDGGLTWSEVAITGQIGTNDFCYVPGTDNIWVSTEANSDPGAFWSHDGGHSWDRMSGTENLQFLALEFIDNTTGWAGGFNFSASNGGIYKFTGSFPAGTVLGPVTGLYSVVTGKYVHLEWTAPVIGTVLGYKVFRNDTLISASPVLSTVYDDTPAPNGMQTYCVSAVYATGESDKACTNAEITFGIDAIDPGILKIWPNPAGDVLVIESPEIIKQVKMLDGTGRQVYIHSEPVRTLRINTNSLKPGIYLISATIENKILTEKIFIR